MILLIILGGFLFIILLISILDAFNITHIFMKGRPSGTIGSAIRTMQDAFELNAKKAHEYIIEEKKKKDISKDGEVSGNGKN